MKVKRLVRGYYIKANDGEFEMLRVLARIGAEKLKEGKRAGLPFSGTSMRAWNAFLNDSGLKEGPLARTDENVRDGGA